MPQTLLLSTTDRNCRPIWHKFLPQGGKEYTIHSIQYKYTVHTSSWLLLSFVAESSASGPQSGKAPYHSLPPFRLYIYISLGLNDWQIFPGAERWINWLVWKKRESVTRQKKRTWSDSKTEAWLFGWYLKCSLPWYSTKATPSGDQSLNLKTFKEPRNWFQIDSASLSSQAGLHDKKGLSYRSARQYRLAESIPWYWFLGPLNVYRFGLRTVRGFWPNTRSCCCSWLFCFCRITGAVLFVVVPDCPGITV